MLTLTHTPLLYTHSYLYTRTPLLCTHTKLLHTHTTHSYIHAHAPHTYTQTHIHTHIPHIYTYTHSHTLHPPTHTSTPTPICTTMYNHALYTHNQLYTYTPYLTPIHTSPYLEFFPKLGGITLRVNSDHLPVGGLELIDRDRGLPAQAGLQDCIMDEDVLFLEQEMRI